VRQNEYERIALSDPAARRWVNQCGGCGRVGVKPEAPEQFSRFEPMGPGLRARFGVLPLDDHGLCGLCARLLDERTGRRPA
jgi:hypothetical protein